MTRVLLPLAALLAAAMPLLPHRPPVLAATIPWPIRWDGRSLERMPLVAADRALVGDFPGAVARFSDGQRQIVLRQVAEPTRRLHPARACFRALGYRLSAAPMRARDRSASCFLAERGGTTLRVCERVQDAEGVTYPDISGWYWAALLRRSHGPWLASMTVERVR